MESPLNILKQCKNLPEDVDIDLVSIYLISLPSITPESLNYQSKLVKYYTGAVKIIGEYIVEAKKIIVQLEENRETYKNKKSDIIEDEPLIRYQATIYKYLFNKVLKLNVKIISINIERAKKHLSVLQQLEILTNWFISNPLPILVNLEMIKPQFISTSLALSHHLSRKNRALKIALKEQVSLLVRIPFRYQMTHNYKEFLRSVVDSAMASRKGGTCYFESPTAEENLFLFFDTDFSPISKAGLLPIDVGDDPSEAIDWINKASAAVATLDGISIYERQEVINVLVDRYFFERTYPKFHPEVKDNVKFSRMRQKILMKTPEEANIPKKYIPESCLNLPVSKIFETSSIAKAPALWMSLMQFKCCPLDISYCIFKVHESLSIMAVLQATENSKGKSSEDFYKKMPGFDDIFDLWICLLCYADLADPRGMNDFIGNWTKLPGFPQRFIGCSAYLEAACAQIDTLIEEEENLDS